MNWTDERVELLKKLWSDGLSASQIAAELGGVTRNAVIGKVHRLKLSGRGKTTKAAPRAKKVAVETVTPAPAAAARPSRTTSSPASAPSVTAAAMASARAASAAASKMEFVEDAASEVENTSASDNVVPISRHLNLLQLSETTCKWPIGDPLSEDFYFCGADSGEASPYCSFHAKIAFQPVSERRRARA